MNLYKNKIDINKIQKILEVYKENNAKAWEIGTDFYGSWTRLINNISQLPIDLIKNNKLDKLEIVEVESCADQQRFKMCVGGYDITPKKHKNNIQSVAKSTIRQYVLSLNLDRKPAGVFYDLLISPCYSVREFYIFIDYNHQHKHNQWRDHKNF